MKQSIDDLLNALRNPVTVSDKKTLTNTKETWERIGNRDSFTELGLSSSELDDFLNEWISENPYENI
jgi:hypothetical protein